VTSWTPTSISYSYTIKNVGTAPANLDGPTSADADNVSVQAFLSADTVFNNAGDIAAGGTILGTSPLGNLNPGETLSGSFSSSAAVNPTATPYLVLKVDWGNVVAESDETNNTRAAPIVTGQPDLVVSSLVVTGFTLNSISYTYTITNIGTGPANLDGPTSGNADNVSVQAVISADTVFENAGDVPAGGTIIGNSPLGNLNPGQSFTGSFSSGTLINPFIPQYLVLMVDWGNVVAESNEGNNTLAVPIF
jgi:subtilase family serine protease